MVALTFWSAQSCFGAGPLSLATLLDSMHPLLQKEQLYTCSLAVSILIRSSLLQMKNAAASSSALPGFKQRMKFMIRH